MYQQSDGQPFDKGAICDNSEVKFGKHPVMAELKLNFPPGGALQMTSLL